MPSPSTHVDSRVLRRWRSSRSMPPSDCSRFAFSCEPAAELVDRRRPRRRRPASAVEQLVALCAVELFAGTGDRIDVAGGDLTVAQCVGQLRGRRQVSRTVPSTSRRRRSDVRSASAIVASGNDDTCCSRPTSTALRDSNQPSISRTATNAAATDAASARCRRTRSRPAPTRSISPLRSIPPS